MKTSPSRIIFLSFTAFLTHSAMTMEKEVDSHKQTFEGL
jgi:hypothetical protein